MTLPPLPAIDAEQATIIEEFQFFQDWSERYQYLIDLGKKLEPLPANRKTDDYRLAGCQSLVWLVPKGDAKKLRFEANSDSAIVSGLIALALRVYSDRAARQIVDTEPDFIAALGLSAHLSPTRNNGLAALIKKIKAYAEAALAGQVFH